MFLLAGLCPGIALQVMLEKTAHQHHANSNANVFFGPASVLPTKSRWP
jgi:hypothetical protein